MKTPNANTWAMGIVCALVTGLFLLLIVFGSGDTRLPEPEPVADAAIINALDLFVSDTMTQAEGSAKAVKKRFWLNEGAEIPLPNQDCYGQADDPSELQWLLDAAAGVLDGQDTLFSVDTEIYSESKVRYYLDESIFAITWKQPFGDFMYTICEVKITDPAQLRRYFADDTYGTRQLYTTTQMASKVNAVVVSSGDYYMCRDIGVVVYNGEVKKTDKCKSLDTCFVDTSGDLIFAYQGELEDEEAVKRFVEENDISFSLAFGPVLVDNGVRCEPRSYGLGQVNDHYPRAAFGQRDKLHYIIVVANAEDSYKSYQTIHQFAEYVSTFGCDKVYSLDGGQTGAIVMNNELINLPQFGEQRRISDMFYFATAVPNVESSQSIQ